MDKNLIQKIGKDFKSIGLVLIGSTQLGGIIGKGKGAKTSLIIAGICIISGFIMENVK